MKKTILISILVVICVFSVFAAEKRHKDRHSFALGIEAVEPAPAIGFGSGVHLNKVWGNGFLRGGFGTFIGSNVSFDGLTGDSDFFTSRILTLESWAFSLSFGFDGLARFKVVDFFDIDLTLGLTSSVMLKFDFDNDSCIRYALGPSVGISFNFMSLFDNVIEIGTRVTVDALSLLNIGDSKNHIMGSATIYFARCCSSQI